MPGDLPMDTTARAAIDGAVNLPLALIQPSPTNPRKHFDEAGLRDLAANIKRFGVLQPILCRPLEDAKPGQPQYEIVAGERRWRACGLAQEAFVPAIVRPMHNLEVIELQLIENLQRSDLTALEEADGYQRLIDAGIKHDDLASRIGKSRSHVFQRLKLRQLGEAGRQALGAGEIAPSVALLIARLHSPADQQRALERIITGWGGEPMSFRSAQNYIQREFMLELGQASFPIADETLVPAAGSCRACPKRAGANPDLFDDVKDGDTCTDGACFVAKADAHRARLKAQAEEAGVKVITGAEAKKAMPTDYGPLKGFLKVDKPLHEVDGKKPLGKLLAKEGVEVLAIENPRTHELVRVVRESDAVKALKARGLIQQAKIPSSNAREREAEARRKRENTYRATLAERVMQALPQSHTVPEYCDLAIRLAAHTLFHGLDNDQRGRAESLMGWAHIGPAWQDADNDKRRRARFAELTNQDLIRLFTAAAMAGELKVSAHLVDDKRLLTTHRLEPLAAAAGIDAKALRAELAREAQAKADAKAHAKPVAKSATKKPLTPEAALAAAVARDTPAPQISAAAADPFRA
jgi:ParB/RepB/Spo0J family partition protein